MNESLPDGYARIDPRLYRGIGGGLIIGGERIIATASGCWHARIREYCKDARRKAWRWVWEQDGQAVGRYRSRAWRLTEQPLPPDHALRETCGDPHCINPGHLVMVRRRTLPKTRPQRFGWIGSGPSEYWGRIDDTANTDTPATPKARGQRSLRPKLARPGHARGEAHCRAKLTADDVRAIRAAEGVPQVDLAKRYGITSAGIRRILTRKAWAHIE